MNEFNVHEIKPEFNSKFRIEGQANVDYVHFNLFGQANMYPF